MLCLATLLQAGAATNLVIWDTITPVTQGVAVPDRSGWKVVPRDLLALETDPAKAGSDPGYYGRDYAFKGDAVVENHWLTAVFASARGQVRILSRSQGRSDGANSTGTQPFRRFVELVPLEPGAPPASFTRAVIVRNAADEVAIEFTFGRRGARDVTATFTFGRDGVVAIQPSSGMKGMRLTGAIECGIVPGFVGDDLLVDGAAASGADGIGVPAEHMFLGLLRGEDQMLVMTWPQGRQRLRLRTDSAGAEPRAGGLIRELDFGNDGQSFYVAAIGAAGVWHREQLKPNYLESDVALGWKRPFPAKWKTQLLEEGVKTAFTFKETRGQIWRGVPGSYQYPVWFEGDTAFLHTSKKVPPKGDAVVYFLEGEDTPMEVASPVEILKATVGRPLSDAILDIAGRKLRTHHRRGGDGVHRACTCGCTDAIQAVFEAGQETARKDVIAGALSDMTYFVQRHVDRIDEYRRFAEELISFTRASSLASPELKPYLDNLETIARQIPQEYTVQKENMKSPEYAGELTRQTLALAGRKATNNLPAYMDLLKAWRGMGGAQDYVVAQCHMITRKLFQEASAGCAQQPQAVELAQEIRARCRQVLRSPDGYEIWAEY